MVVQQHGARASPDAWERASRDKVKVLDGGTTFIARAESEVTSEWWNSINGAKVSGGWREMGACSTVILHLSSEARGHAQ